MPSDQIHHAAADFAWYLSLTEITSYAQWCLYFLQGLGLQLRSPKVQMWSPDPEYASKKAHLLDCLRQAALHRQKTAF
jgi:hypothetical protein